MDGARAKAERVLTNDPGAGVIRQVDAGYECAEQVAAERDVAIPMWSQPGQPEVGSAESKRADQPGG